MFTGQNESDEQVKVQYSESISGCLLNYITGHTNWSIVWVRKRRALFVIREVVERLLFAMLSATTIKMIWLILITIMQNKGTLLRHTDSVLNTYKTRGCLTCVCMCVKHNFRRPDLSYCRFNECEDFRQIKRYVCGFCGQSQRSPLCNGRISSLYNRFTWWRG